jgi:hypothetical protein
MSIQTHFCLNLMLKYGDRRPRACGTGTDFKKINAKVLKSECKARGLKVGGSKADIVARLTGEAGGRTRRAAKLKTTMELARQVLGEDCSPNIATQFPAAKETRSNVMARDGTMKYEAAKDFVDSRSHEQPEFTATDEAAKCRIWKMKPGGYCAFTGRKVSGVGDHMIGMREGIKRGFNEFGVNDRWGKIPCVSGYNSGILCWKKLVLKGETRWITYDEFTEEQLVLMQETQPKKFDYYQCWQEWKKYVFSRGAKLSHPDILNRDETHARILEFYMLQADLDLKETYSMDQEQILINLPKWQDKCAKLREQAQQPAITAALLTRIAALEAENAELKAVVSK